MGKSFNTTVISGPRKNSGGVHHSVFDSWSPDVAYAWVDRLGTISDVGLARQVGFSRSHVGQVRKSLGIPPFKPTRLPPKYRSWHCLVVGTMKDTGVSEKTGISKASVCLYRKKLGIPRFKTQSVEMEINHV